MPSFIMKAFCYVMPKAKKTNSKQQTNACMPANEMKAMFALVYQRDRETEGLVNHNWNVV